MYKQMPIVMNVACSVYLLHIIKCTSDFYWSYKLLWGQSDLGSYCLQNKLPKVYKQISKQMTTR